MSELTTYQQPAAIADYQSRAASRLGEWAHAAQAAYQVAERLVESSFVPQQFRGKPMDATAAILAGSEVGLSPMASLRAFDVIQGQAAPRALTLRAIAQSFGHDIEIVESTATRCVVRARRRGGDWQRITWTTDRARDLGLLGKDQWRKQPQAMLVARATAEAARLVAADAILGIGYTAEEVADGGSPEPVDVAVVEAPAPTGTRRMGRPKPAPAPEEPPLDDPEPERPEVEPITAAQLRALHAALSPLADGDRATGLAIVSGVIGRDIETTKDLSKAEASRVIDALKSQAEALGGAA